MGGDDPGEGGGHDGDKGDPAVPDLSFGEEPEEEEAKDGAVGIPCHGKDGDNDALVVNSPESQNDYHQQEREEDMGP